jgi:L-seryl-tRNA(Ser) seleniumtransferase
VQDLGSGSLVDLAAVGLGDEPTVAAVIEQGVDIVTFSGDKLLGGPQAGIIAGRSSLIDEIKRNPLLRAMRIDKLSLAALAATLRLYKAPNDPFELVPVLRMLSEPKSRVTGRARRLARRLNELDGVATELANDVSFAGGGSLPMNEIPTRVVKLRVARLTATELARRLRLAAPPVVSRVKDDYVVLDMRTVPGRDVAHIVAAVEQAVQ